MLFRSEPLPLRVIAVYPSWDRFAFVFHERTGVRSLKDVRDRQRKAPHQDSLEDGIAYAALKAEARAGERP